MKKIVLNNKSYLDYEEFKEYKKEIIKLEKKGYEFIWLPPMVYLSELKNSKIKVGAQNFYSYVKGSFTGETNLETLKSLNIKTVLVGHYERKIIGLEPYSMIKDKLFKSLNAKFETILCVGELKEKDNPIKYLKKELKYLLSSLEEDNIDHLVIAYEPGWAIGGTDSLSIKEIDKCTKLIKKSINKKFHKEIEVLYGGSVSDDNINDILEVTDGVLVGKLSTHIDKLEKLVKKLN